MANTKNYLERARKLRGAMKAARAVVAHKGDDNEVLECADLFAEWEAGKTYEGNSVVKQEGVLYRIVPVSGVTSQAHQPPNGEGMLAIYRPIVMSAAGTVADPIPYIYGMDVDNGKHYTYEGKTYLAKADLKPCVWNPGTAGVWQWELV